MEDDFSSAAEAQDYSCTVRNTGKEEAFNMDVAYSEQAAVLLKGSFLPESRRLKDGNALTVSTEGISPARIYLFLLSGLQNI